MKKVSKTLSVGAAVASLALLSSSLLASSHMDAPLITLDDAANTTDVYAFRSQDGEIQYLTTALAVYPFEEPGIGPNNYRFDDNVLYQIHVALGDDIEEGRATFSYRFRFDTGFKDEATTFQAFLGPITCDELDEDGFDPNQNLRQTYTVTRGDDDDDSDDDDGTVLGTGKVPPNNQGLVTAEYNTVGGEGVAKDGVASEGALDKCTRFGITELANGHRVFAGQRDDGFYADIQSIFDIDFTFGGGRDFDSQGGFNVHTIVLNIPLDELDGAESAGVFASTSREERTRLRDGRDFERRGGDRIRGKFIQVARQGNPLFNEALVALERKDLYNRTDPTRDDDLFREFAETPELGTNDVSGIFIPDVIRVDLTTGPARLAGPPDDFDFSRLSVFDEDTLINGDGDMVAGGFPNGRRFGDDVLDIALIALGVSTVLGGPFDGVDANDISFNKVFPYAATPLNGRNHGHH